MTIKRFYGRHKYSSIQYGKDTLTRPMFGLTIDWEKKGWFTGRNDSTYMQKFTIERGRRYWIVPDGSGFEEEMTGLFTCEIADPNQEYNPFNVSSPLYGHIGPNRRMKFSVLTPDEVKHDLFTGTAGDLNSRPGLIPMASLSARDGWEILRNPSNTINIPWTGLGYTSEMVPLILEAAEWPAEWGYVIEGDAAPHYPGSFFINNESAARALFNYVFSDARKVLISGSGALTVKARYPDPDIIATITDEDVIYDSVEILQPWEVYRNVWRVKNYHYATQGVPPYALWTSLDAAPIAAGGNYEVYTPFTYNGNPVDSATDLVIPLVASTDYEVNTAADGSGTDLTSQITVNVDELGNTSKVSFHNNSLSAGYILPGMQIRGSAFLQDATHIDEGRNVGENEDLAIFEMDYPMTQELTRNEAGLLDYLESNLNVRGRLPFVSFTLKGTFNPNVQFALDLGRQVTLDMDSFNVNGDYSIAYIKHEYQRKRDYTLTRLFCEPIPTEL